MANPILYTIKKGDTLSSIAKDKGINNWKDLQVYHNQECPVKEQIGTNIREGKTLYVPPKEKIEEMNGTSKGSSQPEPEKKTEDKKPKEEEKKEDSKSEHDNKYYVVHGATCVCDKAEDPTKEAELQVTTHQKMIYNDQSEKFAATEEDKQFKPPAATFGKCTLKPSSSGNQPCALAPAPKWDKPYDKTKVLGKCVLTEISELKCTIGGKITIKKHGQADSVTTAHAQNTNPVELAQINPAVTKPIPVKEYPSVDYITIESVENRKVFTPVKSDKEGSVEKIYVRPNENCSFTANVNKGNKTLTSWVVYDGFEANKDKKLLTKEQIGPSFSNSFPTIGNFRIEGYGKPKNIEFEKGKYDKNYPSCSIDIIIAVNTLKDNLLELHGGEDFAAKIKEEVRLRKDFPAIFKAKFLMPPTQEELSRLEMYVTDEAGNRLADYKQEGKFLTFTPINTNAVYNFFAVYQDEEGNSWTQTFKGRTFPKNYVTSISHTDQIVREFTPIRFEVKQMKIGSFIAADSDLTAEEIQSITWVLNNAKQGTGRVLSIPDGLPSGGYIVEAYCITSNAFKAKAAREDDDWHFEVKRNDVVEIQSDPILKVGKKAVFTASGFVFKDLLSTEKINWTYNGQSILNTKTIEATPSSVKKITVTAKINSEKGVTKTFTVVQPTLEKVMFTDSNGIEIEKSAWGNKVNIWLKEKHLIGEKLKISLQDKGTTVHYFPEIVYDGGLIPLELNKTLRDHTKDYAELKVVVSATNLNFTNKEIALGLLKVDFAREVYSGIIGDQDGEHKHSLVDYDMISWFYGKSRGIKEDEKVTIEVYEASNFVPSILNNLYSDTLFPSGEVSPDKSGAILFKIDWGKIPKAKQTQLKNVYIKVLDNTNQKAILYDGSSLLSRNIVPLKKSSEVLKLAGYSSAAIVGSSSIGSSNNSGTCVCKDYDLIWGNKVSCEFRKKVVEICADLWGESKKIEMANGLMAVMYVETSGSFKAHQIMGMSLKDVNSITKNDFYLTKKNGTKSSRAVGLIQFTQSALEMLGEFKGGSGFDKLHEVKLKFAKMGEIKQLDYVKKYFNDSKEKIKSPEDIYLHVFAPKGVAKNDDYVLYEIGTEEYRQNKSIDTENNNDGKIQRSEILGRYNTSFNEGKSNKAKMFVCKSNVPTIINEVKDLITYKIYYSEGKIEKNIPKKIKEGFENKYKYLYIDKEGKEHNLGTYDIIKTQKYGVKKGTFVNLINLDKVAKSYKNGNYKYNFNVDSPRKFVNEKTLASFFGALLEVNFSDISCNGFSHSDGSSRPSKSHINGNNGDFKYLRADKKLMFGDGTSLNIRLNPELFDPERQNQWNDALYKFGWKSMLGWSYKKNGKVYKLNHIPKNTDHHDHHLHLQGYNPIFTEIKL